jgi:hypothetical protein
MIPGEIEGIVVRFGELSVGGRRLARWSAVAAVATLTMSQLQPSAMPVRGLFDSLGAELRDSTLCAARTPRWLWVSAAFLGLVLIRSAIYNAVFRGTTESGAALDSGTRFWVGTYLSTPGFRPLRIFLVYGSWVLAIAAGAGSMLFAAWVLRRGGSASLAGWAVIAGVTWIIFQVERLLTERRYAALKPAPEPPATEVTDERFARYMAAHPRDTSAVPLIYAYTTLSPDEMYTEMTKRSASGFSALISKLMFVVAVVAIFSMLPAPSVGELTASGFLGCTFVNTHDFFALARDNLVLSITLALVAFSLRPIAVLGTYVSLMREWRVPAGVQREVLRRESGFARRMLLYSSVGALLSAAAVSLVLWLSASIATGLDSPVAGLLTIGIPAFVWIGVFLHSHRKDVRRFRNAV